MTNDGIDSCDPSRYNWVISQSVVLLIKLLICIPARRLTFPWESAGLFLFEDWGLFPARYEFVFAAVFFRLSVEREHCVLVAADARIAA